MRDSDATLLLYRDDLTGGTAFTLRHARSLGRSHALVDLATSPDPRAWADWIASFGVVNVAGPRERRCPGIYQDARRYLLDLLGPSRRVG